MNHKSEPLEQATPLQRAVLALKEVRAQFDAYKEAQHEPLAIVGLGCRFPGGANNPESYWRLLRNGVDAITTVPAERWDAEKFYDANADAPGKISTRHGGFLESLDGFDPQFFGVSPREAASMDPQQRLFLEVAWEALEHAGCAPDRLLNSKTGVFAGVTMSDYLHLVKQQPVEKIDAYLLTGNCLNVVPGRVSFFLGLHGPSLAVDTACSSSLTAVHLACQSLRMGECEMALAGGVNVMLLPELLISGSRAHMFAADGRCKTFDARADGFVRGEGCGVVVLKRLSAAQKNGDRILAVIRGSAINQDGPSSGLTVPNSEAQKALLRAALQNARRAPHQVQYVEAHGTGTALGDPIEVRALGEVLREGRSPEHRLILGSVKTNLGHLEAAAGVAGLIKVALALHHGEIPPHLHLQKINPDISLEEINARIATELLPWPAWGETRLAGVSAFGMSGTNVHVILEGYSDVSAQSSVSRDHRNDRTAHVLTLSAREENALKRMAESYAQHLDAHSSQAFADICYSANVGRAKFSQRLAVVADSSEQARARLKDFVEGRETAGFVFGAARSKRPKLAFLYAGQGCQYLGMGRGLYETQPTFRKALLQCDELFQPYLNMSLLKVLYPEMSNTPGKGEIAHENDPRSTIHDLRSTIHDQPGVSLLDKTFYTQPAMFALQYALTQLWLSWGLVPDAVMGHSLGEFMAAQLAGVYSLEEAVKLVAERARLTEEVPAVGMMASVQAREEHVRKAITAYGDAVCLAAINGPESIVITGRKEEVNDALARFEHEGLNVRRLAISNAFHSPFIEPVLDKFSQVAQSIAYQQPKLPLVSTLTGQLLRFDLQKTLHDPQSTIHDPRSSLLNPQSYWRRHLREPVQFHAAMRTLHDMGLEAFLEIGPSPTQLGMGRRCLPEGYGHWFPSLRQGRDDWQQMLESVGAMFVNGIEVDWQRFDQDYERRRVWLPTYPFQRKRFWIEESGSKIVDRGSLRVGRNARSTIHNPQSTINHPLLQQCTRSPLIKETIFETQLSTARFPYFEDHKVHGMIVLPLTGHLEMILAAAKLACNADDAQCDEIVMHAPLLLFEDKEQNIQIVFTPNDSGEVAFQLISLGASVAEGKQPHTVHVSGKIARASAPAPRVRFDLRAAQARCAEEVPVEDYYEQLWRRGLRFGSRFQGIQKLWRREGEALAQIALPEELQNEQHDYLAHPALLDACLQAFAAAWPQAARGEGTGTFLPLRVENYRWHRRPPARVWSNVVLAGDHKQNAETLGGDVVVYDAEGELVAELRGLLVKRTSAEALQNILQENIDDWFYEIAWRAKPLASQETLALAAPAQLAEAASSLLPVLRNEAGLAAYEEMLPQLDRLCTAYVAQALRQLGMSFASSAHFTLEELAQRLNVIVKHRRLLARMLEMLTEEGVLVYENGAWRVCRAPEDVVLAAQYEVLLQKYPASATEIQLTHKCGIHLAAVLRGEHDPLQLLFPGGSVEVLEKLYQHSPITQAMNRLVARALQEALAHLPKERKLRVLEIGAGTGGTTAFVLPHLPADRAEYVFTDVSPLFLHKAREKFSAHDFVRYQTLDIERDPRAQNFETKCFDLVIAANVLHATADVRQAAHYATQFLAPEGTLVLVEGTARERWVDLTFGLTEGWWKFSDTALRRDYPLLSKTEWLRLLKELQCREARTIPPSEEEAACGRAMAQHALLLARAPQAQNGVARELASRWLIFADANGLGQRVSESLRESSVLVFPGVAYLKLDEHRVVLDPNRAEDFQRLLRDTNTEENCAGVIYLWAMDHRTREDMNAPALHQTQTKCGAAVLRLVQALMKARSSATPRLWLVTGNAQQVASQNAVIEPAQASLWGLGKIISLEHPELQCVRLDLSSHDENAAHELLAELRARDGEDMIAYRNGERYVARLVRVSLKSEDRGSWIVNRGLEEESTSSRSTINNQQSTRLTTGTPGVLDTLQYQPAQRRAPAAHEVEIRVHAVGLNFRDVLHALGMYPGEAGPLGGECSGTISAVGEGVTAFRAGEEVMAIAPGSFGAFVTTHADLVIHKPAHLSFAEATTIPSAFMTAYHALMQLGKLQAGERVLIHSAAGGVGLAAVQLAQRAGAEIFATAGSEEKREYLRALGVRHVYDSRSLAFAEEILRESSMMEGGSWIAKGESRSTIHDLQSSILNSQTKELGVDVVLNSLRGDFIRASFAVLKEGGRFLEIGKRDIWTRAQAEAFKKVGAYHVIDLAATARDNPALVKTPLQEVRQGVEDGSLRPLPMQVFSAEQVVQAFRCMQGAKHIGKIVVAFGEDRGSRRENRRSWFVDRGSLSNIHDPRSSILNPQSTILITGGLAGLGLLTAQWLVEQGARHLALMARSSPSETARGAIAEMEKRGAKIFLVHGDVAREEDVKRALSEIKQKLPALRGIIHSAGVLDDGALLQQSWGRFETVLAPKVYGAWLLHQLTQDEPLELFVLYSSMASMLGMRGQGNHAMANAFLDGLAHYRRSRGQAGVSIHWGAWSEIGAAAERNIDARVSAHGIGAITPQKGLQALDRILQSNPVEVGVAPIDWSKYAEQFDGACAPFFSELRASVSLRAEAPAVAPLKTSAKILAQLRAAPQPLRNNLLLGYVKTQALRVLGLEASQPLDKDQPLQKAGLDSLMAVELRNVLGAGLELKRALPATLLFDYPTIAAVTEYLAKEVLAWETANDAQNGKAQGDLAQKEKKDLKQTELAQLSEEEAEALLLEELEGR